MAMGNPYLKAIREKRKAEREAKLKGAILTRKVCCRRACRFFSPKTNSPCGLRCKLDVMQQQEAVQTSSSKWRSRCTTRTAKRPSPEVPSLNGASTVTQAVSRSRRRMGNGTHQIVDIETAKARKVAQLPSASVLQSSLCRTGSSCSRSPSPQRTRCLVLCVPGSILSNAITFLTLSDFAAVAATCRFFCRAAVYALGAVETVRISTAKTVRPSSSRRFLVSASPKNAVGHSSIQLRPEAVTGSTLCHMLRILQRYATNIANCSVLLHGAPFPVPVRITSVVHDFVIAKCKSIAKLQLSSGLLLTQFVAAKNACIDAVELKLVDFRHAGGDALVWTTSIAAQLHGLEKACFWLAKSNDYPRATTARMMRELLVHCPNLKSLALTYHPEDVATPSPMMWTLQQPPQSVAQLLQLDLSEWANLLDEECARLLKLLPRLQKLSLRACALIGSQTLKQITAPVHGNVDIRDLNLAYTAVSPADVLLLAKSTTLTKLANVRWAQLAHAHWTGEATKGPVGLPLPDDMQLDDDEGGMRITCSSLRKAFQIVKRLRPHLRVRG